MAWIVRDFNCQKCGISERLVKSGISEIVCCGKTALAMPSAPLVVGADSFNPHFDITQGKYFNSAEQKRAWLQSKNKEQVEGNLSPRISEKGRIVCSEKQAQKLVGRKARQINQKELPCLRRNRRTSLSVSSAPSKT